MKAAKMIVAGGLVLTLGAFGPTLARAAENANNNHNSANYSDSSGANDSQSSTANNPGDNAPTATVPENENQSSEANQNPINPVYENENTRPFHPSQAQGQEEQGNENSASVQPQNQQQGEQQGREEGQPNAMQASTAKLSQEQNRIGRMIGRLDRDLSDAETYEAAGREDWTNNDIAGAQRNFRTAERILKMATGGANFGPAFFGQNPHQQEMVAEKALDQAKKAGANVTDAQAYLDQGKQALNEGHDAEASRDFRAAELSLGIPVEVGYAEVWEAEVPVGKQNNGTAQNQQSEPQTENGPVAMAQPNNEYPEMNGMGQNGRNIGDAQMFLRAGERALANGDQAQAQRDFRAAERALSMNESQSYSNSR